MLLLISTFSDEAEEARNKGWRKYRGLELEVAILTKSASLIYIGKHIYQIYRLLCVYEKCMQINRVGLYGRCTTGVAKLDEILFHRIESAIFSDLYYELISQSGTSRRSLRRSVLVMDSS